MNDKGVNRKRMDQVIWIGIGLGVLSWILESIIHAFVLHTGTLIEQIFTPDLHEIWMRTLVVGIIIVFSTYAQSIITKRKRAEEAQQRLNRELVLLNGDLALFNRASQAFSSTLDPDQVLVTVLEEVRHLMGVVACSIWLIDDETGDLVCRHATGPQSGIVRGWRLPPGEGFVGWTARQDESLIVPDVQDDERYFGGVAQQAQIALRSVLSVPLRVKQNVIGVLQVVDTQVSRFDVRDLGLLEPLAASAAIAIDNARLYEQARQEITERRRAETALMTQTHALRESEERYRALFERSNDAIFVVDKITGRYLNANKAAERLTGRSVDELKRLTTYDVTPQGAEERLAWVSRADGSLEMGEVPYVRPDGSTRIALLSAVPLGEGIAFSIAHDITERVQAEERLEREKDFADNLVQTAQAVILVLDPQGRIVSFNPYMEEISGYRLEEVQGKDWFSTFLPQPDHERIRELFSQAVSDIQTRGNVNPIVTKDGRERQIEWYDKTLKDTEGNVVGVLAVGQDITERVQAEKERERLLAQIQEYAQRVQQIIDTVPEGVLLLDADGRVILANPLGRKDLDTLADIKVGETLAHLGNRPLEELLTSPPKGLWHDVAVNGKSFQVIARPLETGPEHQGWVLVIRDVTKQREFEERAQQQGRLAAVGQLAAGIAHDFNNIMAVITLHTGGLLRNNDLDPMSRELIEIINQQAWQASDLIQQILDFSRRAALERRPMDLLVLMKEEVKLLERTLPENVEIELVYDTGPYTVNADPTRVQQMIMNLAVNARDAMPDGGQLRIGLEWTKDLPPSILPEQGGQQWVRITVSDTGTGIPPDVRPHIFDPFFTTKAPDRGTGLGLSQVYGIVKQHDGYIDVTTEMGQGTTFTLYLPAWIADRQQTLIQETQNLVRGQGQTILVVEDSAVTRKALANSLKMLNYRVLEATNGREALELLEDGHEPRTGGISPFPGQEIALVLSDVTMPEMGGQALFQALRQRNSDVKVVLLSGNPLEEELEDLRTQGLSGWLTKPPKLEQLSHIVARALEDG